MRCPNNCNEGKFVSLETGEPEEDSQMEIDDDGNITASFLVNRNCGECGDALKSANFDLTDNLPEEVLEQHTNTPAEAGKEADNRHALSIELNDAEVDESGGGRYRKNILKVVANYVVTCTCDSEFSHDGTAESEGVAASSFEEC